MREIHQPSRPPLDEQRFGDATWIRITLAYDSFAVFAENDHEGCRRNRQHACQVVLDASIQGFRDSPFTAGPAMNEICEGVVASRLHAVATH